MAATVWVAGDEGRGGGRRLTTAGYCPATKCHQLNISDGGEGVASRGTHAGKVLRPASVPELLAQAQPSSHVCAGVLGLAIGYDHPVQDRQLPRSVHKSVHCRASVTVSTQRDNQLRFDCLLCCNKQPYSNPSPNSARSACISPLDIQLCSHARHFLQVSVSGHRLSQSSHGRHSQKGVFGMCK